MEKLTKKQIINETAEYYAAVPKGRRANMPGIGLCEYLTWDGRMCAVGRCLIDPGSIPSSIALKSLGYILDPLLKPEYRGHPIGFWEDLQKFHDRQDHWTETGLTEAGVKYMESMLNDA